MSARGTDEARPGTTDARRPRALLVVVLALLGLGTFVLLFVGMTTTFVDVPEEPPIVLLIAQMTAGILALPFALMLGYGVVQSPPGPVLGRPGRRPVPLLALAGLTVLLALVHLVAAVASGVHPLVIAGILLGLLGAGSASWILGQRVRADLDERERVRAGSGMPASPDLGWTPETIRRKVRTIIVTFLIALVASTALTVVLGVTGDRDPGEAWAIVIQLSFTAAAMACATVVFPVSFASAPITRGLEMTDRRAINRRISGRADELAPDLEWRAARLAAVTRVSQPFIAAQGLLIFVGVAVPTIVRGTYETWLLVLYAALGVVLLAMTPMIVRQQRALRRFSDATRELARSAGPVEDQAVEPPAVEDPAVDGRPVTRSPVETPREQPGG
jgi:MFS family permease